MQKLFIAGVFLLLLLNCRITDSPPPIHRYNVVWHSPSKNAAGSMPLGNGDIGINVWAEQSGDLYCYIGKSDAWNGNASLLKLGKVRVHFTPNPFADTSGFEQRLDLLTGEIKIQAGPPEQRLTITIWVDANHPVIHLDLAGEKAFEIQASSEIWRTQRRQLHPPELHTAYGLYKAPFPVYVEADSLLPTDKDEIIWVHRNQTSVWKETLERQGMGFWQEQSPDPLINNTFGCLIKGESLPAVSRNLLQSKSAARQQHLTIYALTAQTQNIADWENRMHNLVDKIEHLDPNPTRPAHRHYWQKFWERSWIIVSGSPEAEKVSQSYALQRFISACAGRGPFPQKFNGSLFNVDSLLPDFPYDADYRRWGGPYWLQNTRLIYWPMLINGDFAMMQPFFDMYFNALPYAKAATRHFYGHAGAFFPETMYFWGAYVLDNFGWNTAIKPFKHIENQYIRYYFSGALEVTAMMLDYYRYTRDAAFARNTLLPFAHQIVQFYDQHYGRDDAGKIYIYPAQALETYWEAANPMPPVAGLTWNVEGILALPETLLTPEQRDFFKRIARELPEIPVGTKNEQPVFLPAAKIAGEPRNHENPEFYAIFPYRLYGVGKPDLERMRNSFTGARVKIARGWQHYDVNAAYLGLTDEAKNLLVQRASAQNTACRFPAFWGPNYDWIPDQDHGNNILICLQAMLMQTDGDKIMLFPAWPEEWNVDFKIHAPQNTVLTGRLRDGKLHDLQVKPEERREDVEVIGNR